MRGKNFGIRGLGAIMAALLLISLAAGCITDKQKEEGGARNFISIQLARKIDEQLGPIDTSDPVGGPLSHLGNNLHGLVNMETVLAYLRLVQDTSLRGMTAAGQGTITSLPSPALLSPMEPASEDNNPCTQDLDNDGNPDYTDLCLGRRNEVNCLITGPRSFKILYSDCRWPDPEYERYLIHYTNTTATNFSSSAVVLTNQVSCTTTVSSNINCFTGTTLSPHGVNIVGTSTAYWNLNGEIVYHNGLGGVDEQIIEITYYHYRLDLQDFLQTDFADREDLDNAGIMLNGQHLIYQVLQPNGTPALGSTDLPDGMDIFNLAVAVDDDGPAGAEAQGEYEVRMAVDWEDGWVFLQKNDAVLPSRMLNPMDFPMPIPGWGHGISWILTFYDQNHLWNDGLGTGCQVVVENVDEMFRTFDIMDPGLLPDPCPGIEAGSGFEF